MSVTGGIFLYVTGGRTLWVAGHTPAPGENKPVQMLNFATPRELSRSFYLFDMPVHIVNDAATAAMVPGGKTAEDVIMAVNEFRRVCAEDQEFLLRRCYDPKKPPPPTNESTSKPMQQQQSPMQPQQQQIQQLLSSMAGMTDGFGMTQNPAFNASNTNATQTALLLQLLQQRAATSQNASPFQQSPPNMAFNPGVAALGPNAMSAAGNMMLNNNGMVPNVPPMRYNTNYLNPMMTMGGRGDGLMPAPNAAYHRGPGMRHNPSQMMGGRGGGARGGHLQNNFQSTVRNQPEPLPPLPPIPKDVLDTYMNPSQKLICATMPGPRCTVWLRAHEIPTDTKNQRYVFCKGGIVLMLKTKGSEVEHSKPVELFGQQLCAHFLIHNYCSRNNCLHRHHTEEQLRQLIAGKYMELKSMTKKERHSLSERLLEKEREGIAKAEEDRQRRAQEQMEAARRREAALNGNDGNSNNNSGGAVSAPAETIRPPPAQTDVGNSGDNDNNNNNNNNKSDEKSSKGNNDGDGDTAVEREGSNDDSCASNFGNDKEDKNNKSKNNNNNNNNNNNKVSESPSRLDHETREKTRAPVVRRGGGPFASRRVVNPVDIGVTDDEDDDDRSSSSSASSLSATSSASAEDCKDRAGKVSKLIDNKEEKEKEKEKEGNDRHKSVDMPAVETSTQECAVVHNVENDDGVATAVERGNDAEVKNEEEKNENEETVKQADDAAEEKESEAVEKGKKENEEDEVSEVAEDENKKKPKERAGGTKRTRSPVVKKSTAKGKRAKK